MAKKRITLDQAKGKVLTDQSYVDWGKVLVLIFGDEYCWLAICYGYERGDEEIDEEEPDLECWGSECVKIGLYTQEEIDAWKERKKNLKGGLKVISVSDLNADFRGLTDAQKQARALLSWPKEPLP